MKSKSEILEQQENAQGYKITEYVGKDGYVWQMILNAMEEYAQQQVNGVETGKDKCTLHDVSQRSELLAFINWYDKMVYDNVSNETAEMVVDEYLKANCG